MKAVPSGLVGRTWWSGIGVAAGTLAAAEESPTPAVNATQRFGREGFPTWHPLPAVAPRAVILFGSGDGGRGHVENRTVVFL